MTQSSFYSDIPNYAADIPAQNDSNTNPVTGNTTAPSSFYQGGSAYSTTIGVPGPSDPVGPSQAPASFYGSAANYAASYPTLNDANTNPVNGNSAAPSAFYQNGQNYQQADPAAAYAYVTQAQAAAAAAAASLAAMTPSNATPLMDGVAAPGTSTNYARGDHRHPTDTTLAPLASPALTGTPTAPTPTAGDNSTKLATTAYADGAVGVEKTRALAAEALLAPLASPALTGTPTAPTAAVDTNTTQVASTAFVLAQASGAGDGTPAMDGTATRGASTHFARADHVHPTDTSRQAALGYTPLNKAGDSMTSGLLSLVCTNNIAATTEIGTLEVKGNGTTTNAAMSFHIPGTFGANFGLANDGNLYLGGWSHGAVAYKLWTQRDFNYTPVNKAGDVMSGELSVNAAAGGSKFRLNDGNYGTMLYNDGTNFYILLTNAGNPTGSFNGLRPFYINQSNGNVNMNHTLTVGGLTAGSGGVHVDGNLASFGTVTRQGVAAAGWGSSTFNTYWTGSALQCWVDSTNLGNFFFSDYRVKKDVKDFKGSALDEIRKWRLVTYTGADHGIFKANDTLRTSFLAHELQAISPDCVNGEKDGEDIQTLEPLPIIARLAKAIQELDAQNKALQQDVKQLQAQISNGNGPPPK